MSLLCTLADLTPDNRNKLLIALAILMALVIVGGFGILLIRRRLNNEEDADASASVGFSLSELRAMRDRGELTAEEYEITKARVIDKVKSSLAGPQKKQKPTGGFPLTPPDEQPPA
jgi:hypothetical protein